MTANCHTRPRRPSSICKLVFVFALSASATTASAQSRPSDALSWLSGCWERRTPTAVVEEHWSSPSGGTLLMFGRTLRRDSVLEYEFVRVFEKGDTLIYDARPSGQAPAEFRATPPFQPTVTFSNPTHDYPQRVIYRRLSGDSLLARVEGTRNGQSRGIDFAYRRVSCGSP